MAEEGKLIKYCFEAASWNASIQKSFVLRQVHRQVDPIFVGILNRARVGEITSEDITILRSNALRPRSSEVEPTVLCTHVKEAENYNNSKLENLGTRQT